MVFASEISVNLGHCVLSRDMVIKNNHLVKVLGQRRVVKMKFIH